MIKDFPMEIITGIEKIDLQHMELISRIRMLHESFLTGTNAETLLETFYYIKNYINEHLKLEETYMADLDYPYAERHKEGHKEFVANYSKLEELFKSEGTSSDFNLDFNVQLIDWLKAHVLSEDKELAEFILGKKYDEEKELTDLNLNNE